MPIALWGRKVNREFCPNGGLVAHLGGEIDIVGREREQYEEGDRGWDRLGCNRPPRGGSLHSS